MYKNRKFNKNTKPVAKENKEKKRPALNIIDENASMKIARKDNDTVTTANLPTGLEDVDDDILAEVFQSEENIPASQEPTQRYLSQRSITATLARTQSRNTNNRTPNTFFEMILMNAGVHLEEADTFVLSCNHIAFVSKLREAFIKSQNYPENIETFKSSLRDALSDKSKFTQKLLSGCTISVPGEDNVYQSQDSMFVNFLLIDFLRDHVVEVLLDRIEEISKNNVRNRAHDKINLLPLMLAQLRYVTQTHAEQVYERMKTIFEHANESAKWDLISSAEFVFDSSKHDDFTQLLINNTTENKIFNAITIQTLINLSLSAKMQVKLRCKIMAYIKEYQCPNALMPLLIKLLLKVLKDNTDDSARELINDLREIFIWRADMNVAGNNADANEKQTQLELFSQIEQGLTCSKKFYTNWQKLIASLQPLQFKSFDFVILLLLIRVKEDNSLFIENLLRRRIKLEHITVEILNDCKKKYEPILEQLTNILMQILHDFLREKTKAVTDFARSAYGILFEICESVQKFIIKKLLELTCDKSSQHMINLSLELLKDIQRKYPSDVQNWAMLLMPLLDRLNELNLSQTRLVMDLLCAIAYPAPKLTECPALQDQIDMVVKKQIISRIPFIKKQGIIGTVQLIDCIARIEENNVQLNDDELEQSNLCITDLPEGRGKLAANYIERIQSSTMYCAESLALFYDELAVVCYASPEDRPNSGYFDKLFLNWLCLTMTAYFQDNFVTEHEPERVGGVAVSHQKCINSLDDISTNEEDRNEITALAVNIAEVVLKPSVIASKNILILAPLFNLVSVLHLQTSEGSLEQINALLGCAIILPTFFDTADPNGLLYDYDEQLQKKILDIYFHCVNWMRAIISSFASQEEETLKMKVLQRLADLIKIEDKIRKLLLRAPHDYMPPMCQFLSSNAICTGSTKPGESSVAARAKVVKSNKNKATKKATRAKPQENLTATDQNFDETIANISNCPETTMQLLARTKSSEKKICFEKYYGAKEIYRQINSEIILLLNTELNISYPLPEDDVGKKIGLLELRFLMNDLVCKLESITGVQKFQMELTTMQHIAKPHLFMMDMSKFLTKIVENMTMLSTAINAELKKVNHAYGHADLFTESFNYIKVGFNLCLQLLAAFFSWSKFQEERQAKLLKRSLLSLFERNEAKKHKDRSVASIAKLAFTKCLQYETSILSLRTAIHLHQLQLTLKRYSSLSGERSTLEQQEHDIRSFCKKMLLRKWHNYNGETEKGAQCNIYLDELVKGFLKNSDFSRQREILRILIVECKHFGGKDSALKSFPNIKKANFPLLYRGLCDTLITSLNDLINSHKTDANAFDQLKMWEESCNLINKLLEFVVEVNVPRNYQMFLKYAHIYVKTMLQHGLPICEQFLRKNPERVSKLFKDMQIVTRFLHKLCCHSKAIKNASIVNQIPVLRETIETFVFRVKALLAANKCSSVFLMNNLSNKDIHGDVILSQTATLSSGQTEQEANNSDEDIPDDDESVNGTINDAHDVSKSDIANEDSNLTRTRSSKSSSRSKCF